MLRIRVQRCHAARRSRLIRHRSLCCLERKHPRGPWALPFSWDDDKAASNADKHGVSFEAAVAVFDDENAVYNVEGLAEEVRMQVIGHAGAEGVLLVVLVEVVEDEDVRIISARRATKRERKAYAKQR